MACGRDGKKLKFWEEKSGYQVMYNDCLRETLDPKEAEKLAKARWEALPEDEKDLRKAAAKEKWLQMHPPPPPPPAESAEDRMRWVAIS